MNCGLEERLQGVQGGVKKILKTSKTNPQKL